MRLRRAFAAGALVTAGALTAVWLAGPPERPAQSAGRPSPIGVGPRIEPAPEPPMSPTPSAPPEPVTRALPRPEGASRAEVERIALEEAALRRVDVVALLEGAGVDAREFMRRSGADEELRRLAADEVLTRMYMRKLSSARGYPPDYLRELAPAERATQLARELAEPASPPPEPVYLPRH